MSRGFVTNLGDLFIGHDRRKYSYLIYKESKSIINGKRAYEYVGKSCTILDAESKVKELEDDPCYTVHIMNFNQEV